jgi:glycogen operon protein
MDERHLPPLGLANGWGYNPGVFMAPDPRLAPGGPEELRATVARLHEAGISVILDVVYNHSAESDAEGPTISLRGLDNAVYYRHFADDPGRLVNDTACGNTLACDRAPVLRLVTDAMRHWVEATGIDGFRFDLATVLGRTAAGYSPEAPLLSAIRQDPLLREVRLIAEPWDVGPGGYRLGEFATPFLEWNDKYRDDIRRFWRNDAGAAGPLATRLAGSSDVLQAGFRRPSASVNFVACHDGFALADIVSYAQKHNEANGEQDRDGSNDNHSWNNGVEGDSGDAAVTARRSRDIRALLATLFLSRGTPMLTAGDELGRSQRGNNNAYCQDNEITWIDWAKTDRSLADFVAGLTRLRAGHRVLREDTFFTGRPVARSPDGADEPADVAWLAPSGQLMHGEDWGSADILGVAMASSPENGAEDRLCVIINRRAEDAAFRLPDAERTSWVRILDSAAGCFGGPDAGPAGEVGVAARSVTVFAPAKLLAPAKSGRTDPHLT